MTEVNNTITLLLKANIQEAANKLNSMKQHIAGLKKPTNATFKNLDNAQKTLSQNMGRLQQHLGKTQVQFAGWAMSIMFFGMAIKRIFDQIWKFGTKTFQDVMHSVDGTVTAFDILEGSVKYLGFTLGEALEPVAVWLLPIVDKFSDWVTQNENLVRNIIIWAGILGTAFLSLGALKLAIDGFTSLGLIIGTMSSPIGIVSAALAVIAGLTWKAFNETPAAWEALKDTFDKIDLSIIKEDLKDMLDNILPDSILTWENLAWTIAWAVSQIITKFRLVFNAVSVLINSFMVLYNVGMSVVDLFTLNFDSARDRMKQVKKDFIDIGEAAMDFNNILKESQSMSTVAEFKSTTEAIDKSSDLATFMAIQKTFSLEQAKASSQNIQGLVVPNMTILIDGKEVSNTILGGILETTNQTTTFSQT